MFKCWTSQLGIILLFPVNWLWCFLLTLRRSFYKYSGKQKKFNLPIISIGNISHGGTGKTPVVQWIAKYFEGDLKLVIITRGYKSQFEKQGIVLKPNMKVDGSVHGDEPTMLIENLSNTHIVLGKNRKENLKNFLEENIKDVAILEDGFQHLQIVRDLDIVLIDSSKDEDKVILNLLHYREPLEALGDADIIILTNCQRSSPKRITEVKSSLKKYISPDCRIYHASYSLSSVCDGMRQEYLNDFLKDKEVLAFCGIANPENFWMTLERSGAKIVFRTAFADHHRYTQKDIDKLVSKAKKLDLVIVTTEKDFVKLENLNVGHPLFWTKISLEFGDDEEMLIKDLQNVMKRQEIKL